MWVCTTPFRKYGCGAERKDGPRHPYLSSFLYKDLPRVFILPSTIVLHQVNIMGSAQSYNIYDSDITDLVLSNLSVSELHTVRCISNVFYWPNAQGRTFPSLASASLASAVLPCSMIFIASGP